MDGPTPRLLPDGTPEWRLAFLPTLSAQVIETWDSPGLRGTGSHDLALDGARVPEGLFVQPVRTQPRHDGPL